MTTSGWVFQWTEKGNEIVQEENTQSVGNNEISLNEVNAKEEEGQDDGEGYPPGDDVNGGFVKPVLDGSSNVSR